MRLSAAIAVALACLPVASCSRSQHPLSGAVTYGGKPVPVGEIFLTPDEAKGNRAPSVTVEIKGGRYQTPAGRGQWGGAYRAVISGYDGKPVAPEPGLEADPRGRPLFQEYAVQIDLPEGTATYDFAIPPQPAPPKQ